VMEVLAVIQWFIILFTGKRHLGMWGLSRGIFAYDDQRQVIRGPTWGNPRQFCQSDEELRSLEQATPAARDSIALVLDPPWLEDETRELWRDLGRVAAGTLPAWARSIYGFAELDPESMEREPVRQLIGALDLAFETLPGVMEARERIELRMRA